MQASLASVHGDGMDAGVEATQEQLPDALSTNPVTRTRTLRTGGPQGADAGCRFLLVTSLLDKQKSK
jgi:hypothetical protein